MTQKTGLEFWVDTRCGLQLAQPSTPTHCMKIMASSCISRGHQHWHSENIYKTFIMKLIYHLLFHSREHQSMFECLIHAHTISHTPTQTNIDNMHRETQEHINPFLPRKLVYGFHVPTAALKTRTDLSQTMLPKGQHERFYSDTAGEQLMFAVIHNHFTSIS